MKFIQKLFDKQRHLFEKGGKFERLQPLFEAKETFMFVLPKRTKSGAHIRDNMDTKRLMSIVIVALVPTLFFGMYNVGYQNAVAFGKLAETSILDRFITGAWYVLPIVLVSYAAGGVWEVLFAVVRKHEINEGFLVTGMLVPLIVPPTIPLWQVALGVSFGVVIGKEVFGGTGMNIFNPALTARAFLFFAYAGDMSGDSVWVAELAERGKETVQAYSGATPLAVVAAHADSAMAATQSMTTALAEFGYQSGDVMLHPYTWTNMFIGLIPGSIGETSTLLCLLGAVFLIATGIGSWRIMGGVLGGAMILAGILNFIYGNLDPATLDRAEFFLMAIPPHYHLVMGGFAFGLVYMATDPVSASQTKLGKWIYGILIGIVVIIIRVFNTAFPEGMMLSILFANVFASMIDHYVVQANMKRRQARVAKA